MQAEYGAPKLGYSWGPTRSAHAEGHGERGGVNQEPDTAPGAVRGVSGNRHPYRDHQPCIKCIK